MLCNLTKRAMRDRNAIIASESFSRMNYGFAVFINHQQSPFITNLVGYRLAVTTSSVSTVNVASLRISYEGIDRFLEEDSFVSAHQ
tara:strand:+ start:701 stop:958 length:258 start_codon:yes stop_codon:yes gene_type:complete